MRVRPYVVGLLLAACLAGCGLPHRKEIGAVDKLAATRAQATTVLVAYNTARSAADAARDENGLGAIEAGYLLDIDIALYEVSRILNPNGSGSRSDWSRPTEFIIPRAETYPLWFAMVVENSDQQTQVAAVFVRESATGPWKAVAAPQLAAETKLPDVAVERGGGVAIEADERGGLAMTPEELVTRYCDVLSNPRSSFAPDFDADSFVQQMRRVQSQDDPGSVEVSQSWSPLDDVRAVETADGGALVFASVQREDTFTVTGRKPIRWQADNPASAFQPGKLRERSTLTYLHQLLFYVPAEGSGTPRVIGQVGGIVDATGR